MTGYLGTEETLVFNAADVVVVDGDDAVHVDCGCHLGSHFLRLGEENLALLVLGRDG